VRGDFDHVESQPVFSLVVIASASEATQLLLRDSWIASSLRSFAMTNDDRRRLINSRKLAPRHRPVNPVV
jgi:hypothetical protein